MKKRFFKPGFEMLFSAGVIAALALPQILFAQNRKEYKEVRITIKGIDTTFNGKNIKSLAPKEKEEALAEINKTTQPHRNMRLQLNEPRGVLGPDSNGVVRVLTLRYDTSGYRGPLTMDGERFKDDNINGGGRVPNMRFRMDSPGPRMDGMAYNDRPIRIRNFRMGSMQNFDYNNTGKDGISTHISYRVNEAMNEEAKRVAGTSTNDLELMDLTLTPQFSAGKTVLNFSLPAKAVADVQLTDSEGKAIWKDKAATATFTKTFTWGLNGVYYLVVKQGGKTVVKRIIKE